MKPVSLDQIDREIIRLLIDDARMPFSTIAELLKVAPATVHMRYDKLCQAGVIIGSTLRVDRKKLGLQITAFVELEYAKEPIDVLTKKLLKMPEVIELHNPAGSLGFLVKVVVNSVEKLDELIENFIKINGVERTTTHIILRSQFERTIDIATMP